MEQVESNTITREGILKNSNQEPQVLPAITSPQPITKLAGWNIPEEIIRDLAYSLWKQGFSESAEANWFEAVRRIENSVSS